MKILGIETSCDETSAAVISADTKTKQVSVLSNIVASSLILHARTGGIIPEIAAREQMKYIVPVIDKALTEAQTTHDGIDAIAITVGPGLIGSLLVGVETAKTLSLVWKKPLIPVNHLYGHIYANWITEETNSQEFPFPVLALIVSGGHTDLVLLKSHASLQWIAGTRDDAAGEAFDKIGRLLGLSYPAGPLIETLARNGDPKRYHFPRPLLHENSLDFSFSGLKTAVLREVQKINSKTNAMNEQTIADLARATQDALIEVLVKKTLKAAKQYEAESIILSGGVSANQTLTNTFTQELQTQNLPYFFHVPHKKYCTDNAAMIATAAFFNNNQVSWDKITADPELYFD